MKIYFSIALTLSILTAVSQEEWPKDSVWKEASKESQAYHEYRLIVTKPPYSLQKIINLVNKLKMDDKEQEKIPEKTYASFSLREKFTYNMIHEESYSQICDAEPPILDEQKKIFAQLPTDMDEYNWSKKQIQFFIDNRDSVMKLMTESIVRSKHVGLNFKQVIIEINAKEMVPALIKTYTATKKDHDILTILMLLMKNNKYKPFLTSMSYKKLYGDEDASYQSYITFNNANENLILKRATDFYNETNK